MGGVVVVVVVSVAVVELYRFLYTLAANLLAFYDSAEKLAEHHIWPKFNQSLDITLPSSLHSSILDPVLASTYSS